MPNTDPYADAAAYRLVFKDATSPDGNDTELTSQLLMATRYLEHVCNRVWWVDAAPTTRLYQVRFTASSLPVEEMAAVPTVVEIDSTGDGTYEESVTGFRASRDGDFNALSGAQPRALNEIHLTSASSRGAFNEGEWVRVTALHGAPSVPADIRSACIQLTGVWRMQSPRATGSLDEFGRAIQLSPLARDIVASVIRANRRRAVA